MTARTERRKTSSLANPTRSSRVTSVEIARELGVSQSTVSRALSDDPRIAQATRERVQTLARDWGYTPNAIARSLITKRTNIVGIVMNEITSPFYPFVLEKFSKELHARGWRVLLFTTDAEHEVDDLLPMILEYQVDGLIVASATLSSAMSQELSQRGTPLVLFNRYTRDARVAAVSCDNRAGGRVVADALLEAGHERFAFIAGRSDTSTSRDREAGFLECLLEHGVSDVMLETGNFSYESGFAAADRLLALPTAPDAMFCANDITALGALDAARQRGVRVGTDLSIVGFDDIPAASWSGYALATVRQPVDAMIASSLELLFRGIDSAQSSLESRFLPGELIRRASLRDVFSDASSNATKRSRKAARG
jgi:DNA-binding LacI/PurR family transcriptional regulator